MLPWYLLMPLAGAVIYAVASLFLKKALSEGLPPMASFHINNWAGSIFFAFLAFWDTRPLELALLYQPVITGLVFYIGGWFTFAAMQRGDVSLVTPLLGAKVVFVALGVALTGAERMPLVLWGAAVITTAGIFLMSATDLRTPRGGRLAGPVALALISAACFALADVLVQRWAAGFGPQRFLAFTAGSAAALSGLAMLLPGRPVLRWCPATRWSTWGSLLIGIQALLVGVTIATYRDAVGVNVVYATRGLWILVVVAVFGPLIGNLERKESGGAYRLRVVSSLLLLAGVACAVLGRMGRA